MTCDTCGSATNPHPPDQGDVYPVMCWPCTLALRESALKLLEAACARIQFLEEGLRLANDVVMRRAQERPPEWIGYGGTAIDRLRVDVSMLTDVVNARDKTIAARDREIAELRKDLLWCAP